MPEYGILSKDIQFIDDCVDGYAVYHWGKHWDIIEAPPPPKLNISSIENILWTMILWMVWL